MKEALLIFLAVPCALQAGPKFITPIEGEPFKDWTIVNYVDRSPPGTILDYTGGSYSYDGHNGVDFTLPHFLAMDAGCNVLAAADGVVTAVHDSEYDRNTTTGNFPVNQVVIDHGEGWTTRYLHLKKDSSCVSLGDSVKVGDKIGEVGSSGSSTDAHLHFEVRNNGNVADPFFDGLWAAPLPYAGTSPGLLDVGMSDRFSTTSEFKDGPKKMIFFEPDALCVHWVQLYSVDSSDVLKWEFYTPMGNLYSKFSTSPNELIRYGWYHAGWYLPGKITGKWTSKFYINGDIFSELDFYASDMKDSDFDQIYDDVEEIPLIAGRNDALIDSDGDGFTNSQEFFFNTDPLDNKSKADLHVSIEENTVRMRFDAPYGRRLYIQKSSSLDNNGFINFRHVCSGHGRTVSFDVNSVERAFFRISCSFEE